MGKFKERIKNGAKKTWNAIKAPFRFAGATAKASAELVRALTVTQVYHGAKTVKSAIFGGESSVPLYRTAMGLPAKTSIRKTRDNYKNELINTFTLKDNVGRKIVEGEGKQTEGLKARHKAGAESKNIIKKIF